MIGFSFALKNEDDPRSWGDPMKTSLHRLLLVLVLPVAAHATVSLAPLFRDHAVLQRDKQIPVWGSAAPGEHVAVSFRGQNADATAGADGRWTVSLAPLAASKDPSDLVVVGTNRIAVHDVLVGEVWLCSGQSNMQFTVWDPTNPVFRVKDGEKEVAAGNHPLIRQFDVGRVESDKPLDSAEGSWVACTPGTVGNFTAVGYFFARDIQQKLGIPVGIINCSWGGSSIEPWLSREAFANDLRLSFVGERWRKEVSDYPLNAARRQALIQAWFSVASQARRRGPDAYKAFLKQFPEPKQVPPPDKPYPTAPSRVFNGMVHPLLPYALRGVLWYQGESNTGHPREYRLLFSTLITSWRAAFGQGDFPFYWVQLANFDGGDPRATNWAALREAQAETLSLPATGMAVTIDIGEADNIHPRNKQEVGRRLALIAKAKVYGIMEDFSGPVYSGFQRSGSALVVSFRNAGTGLMAAGKPLQSFELAGNDRRFHPATATIAGDEVLVQSPMVPNPAAVRYAWRNAPEANLYNGAGLPAVPFRSDRWSD
jgi:sialate O-acetylesterase